MERPGISLQARFHDTLTGETFGIPDELTVSIGHRAGLIYPVIFFKYGKWGCSTPPNHRNLHGVLIYNIIM
jgi:hypothetical protein